MRTRTLGAAREVAREVARAIVASDGRGNGCVLDRSGDGWPEQEGGSLAALGLQTAPRGLSFWEGSPGVPPEGVFRPLTSAEVLSVACGFSIGTATAIEGLRAELAEIKAEKTGRRPKAVPAPVVDPIQEAEEEPAELGTTRWTDRSAP